MDIVLPAEVEYDIGSSEVAAFEGFEMTGKSYLAKQVHQKWPSVMYRPDWEGSLNDKVVRRGNRYIPGLVVVDLFKSILRRYCQPSLLIIDRWLAVSYVYRILYEQPSDCADLDEMVKSFRTAANGLRVVILHKSHADKSDAKFLYEKSLLSDHDDKYDQFASFEDYWKKYNIFNDAYLEFYQTKCPFPVYDLASIDNRILHEWRIDNE